MLARERAQRTEDSVRVHITLVVDNCLLQVSKLRRSEKLVQKRVADARVRQPTQRRETEGGQVRDIVRDLLVMNGEQDVSDRCS
jgi:hypothetical protein